MELDMIRLFVPPIGTIYRYADIYTFTRVELYM